MNLNKLEAEAPGFTWVYKSVKRLALFHKIDLVDCQEIALLAIVEHPGNLQAATRAARGELNAERRQRRGGRPIDDRTDGDGEGVEVEADRRVLPGGFQLTHLNDEGEYQDQNDQGHGDQVNDCTEDHDTRRLPTNVHGLIGAIMFWADRGMNVKQIAERVGRTQERIRQILNDPEKIRRAVAYAKAHPTFPGLGLENCPPAPGKKIKHKPRDAHPIAQDRGCDQDCLPLF
ncbi:hypothetical protein [Acidiferrobacter sp. SPIII_3]|jgi:hypothetical protein|uniref:hypothetical protein n=1 Tax=Acidiferrobacter sp. SPIII_3 TaxID=1281578 RepID=UPI00143D997A|nr:hypothetical protein [Acidiferrobacter sp. SPIII_3]